MKTNIKEKSPPIYTGGGGQATPTDPFRQLKRLALSCLLWEDLFYSSGSDLTLQVIALVPRVKPEQTAALACEARDRMHLRHMPLFLCRELARLPGNGALVANTLERIIQRADELAEFLNLYLSR